MPAVWWQQDIASGLHSYERAAAAIPAAVIICISDYAVAAQRVLAPSADIRKIHLGVAVLFVGFAGKAYDHQIDRTLDKPGQSFEFNQYRFEYQRLIHTSDDHKDAITAQVITSPYHLIAIPRQDGPVRFERVQQ